MRVMKLLAPEGKEPNFWTMLLFPLCLMDGLQPQRDGLQPQRDALQPKSDGLQPRANSWKGRRSQRRDMMVVPFASACRRLVEAASTWAILSWCDEYWRWNEILTEEVVLVGCTAWKSLSICSWTGEWDWHQVVPRSWQPCSAPMFCGALCRWLNLWPIWSDLLWQVFKNLVC